MKEIYRVMDEREEALRSVDPLGLGPNATSLDFHRAVYRSPSLPISTRQRSAIAALQYEHPRLSISAIIDERALLTGSNEPLSEQSKLRMEL